jgi:hypothetical protein
MWDPKMNPGQSVTPMEIVESALPDLLGVLEDDPATADIAHLSLVAFGEYPVPLLELSPVGDDPALKALPRMGATNYAAIFDWLTRQIAFDHQRLLGAGLQTYTPVVYFLTDGNPYFNGAWQNVAEWVPIRRRFEEPGYPTPPIIVALGIGNVSEATIRSVASDRPKGLACIASPGSDPGVLLRAILDSIVYSIGHSSAAGGLVFETPSAMRRLP